jgi:hypothetical protein
MNRHFPRPTEIAHSIVSTLGSSRALAQVLRKLNCQGFLTNTSLSGSFRIHKVPIGGSAPFTEKQKVNVGNGLFNVALGTKTALTLPFDTVARLVYWLK